MSLTEQDYSRAASILGCEAAAIHAVADLESNGAGFLPDGRPRILFEASVFSRLTEHIYDQAHPDISSYAWNRSLYRSGTQEYERMDKAAALNRDAAWQAASWGTFQIMGMNWRRCGYASLQDFVDGMHLSESEHLTAFCKFIQSSGLSDELQRKDWLGFALGYNGRSEALNHYDTRLAMAYASYA